MRRRWRSTGTTGRFGANIWDQHSYPYTIADAEEWIAYAMQQEPEMIFAIASADEAIGCIGMLPQGDVARLSAEVGYWLGEPFWNLGITTGALKALTEYAFSELGLVRLYATVMEMESGLGAGAGESGLSIRRANAQERLQGRADH